MNYKPFTENDRKRLDIKDNKYPFFSSIDDYYNANEIYFIDGNNTDIKENIKHIDGFLKDFVKRMSRENLITDKMSRTIKKGIG